MAFRDKARERLHPFLEPGEEIQEIFLAQTGPNPRWMFLTTLVMFSTRYHVVAVTDRAILVTRSGSFKTASPKAAVTRLPRHLVLGPAKGLWAGPLYLTPDGKKSWVHKRFQKDVKAADERLAASGVQPIGHVGQPPQPAGVAQPPVAPPPPPPVPTAEGASF